MTDTLTTRPYADTAAQVGRLVAHTLRGEGFDASEDGTGRGVPVISFSVKDTEVGSMVELAPCLRAMQHAGSTANAGGQVGVLAISGRDRGDDGRGYGREPHISTLAALDATKPDRVFAAHQVRRLTPLECERLQGLPDDYTLIPLRRVACEKLQGPTAYRYRVIDGAVWLMAADGPRYRAIGNGMAIPPVRWIGERIALMERVLRELR